MKKTILLTSIVLSLYANDLDSLLEDYAVENDLSNETKIEKTGSTQLIVYTRDDLDNLQYQTLKDVLTMQRFYSYRENRFGQTDLIDAEPFSIGKAGQTVKVYIDNFELTTMQYDSIIQLLGNMELDFVDHLEIYQGPPSFDVSTQFSVVSIKLYSKTPSRDNGNRIGAIADQRASHKVFFHTASAEEKLKYFLYASESNYQSEKIKNGTTDLSRDETSKHLFATFQYDEHDILLQYLTKNKDAFLTNSYDGTPTRDEMQESLLHIGYKTSFLNNSLKFKANFTRVTSSLDALDDNPYLPSQYTSLTASTNQLTALNNPLAGIAAQIVANSSGAFDNNTLITFTNTGIYGEKYKSNDDVFTAELTKNYQLDAHNMLFGISYRNKHLSYDTNQYITSAGTVSVLGTPVLPYYATYSSTPKANYLSKQITYALYAQDEYTFNPYNTLSVGAKIEKEDNNYYSDATLLDARVSYIYEKEQWMSMLYYTYMEANKNAFYFNTASKDLENEKAHTLGYEIKYREDNFDINYNFVYIYMPNLINIDSNLQNYNMTEPYKLLMNSIMFNYKFNEKNSLMIEPWYQYGKAKQINDFQSYSAGLNARIINTIDKFVIYHELSLLRNDPKYQADKYESQYNMGLTYQYNKDLTLYFRGVNILNGRSGYSYFNYYNKTKNINSTPETYSLGLEYTF